MNFFFKKLGEIYPVGILFLVISFVYILSVSSFPLSEGWWETYAYLEMNNLYLFKNIDIAFTPLFVYINKVLLKIFDVDFYLLRLVGVGVFCLLLITFFLFLQHISNKFSAVFSLLVSSVLYISSDPFIAKDYHTYLHLLTVLSFIFFYLSLSNKKLIIFLGVTFLTITLFFIVALKQNVGLLLIVSYFMGFWLSSPHGDKSYFQFWFYLLSVLLISILVFQSNYINDYIALITENDSKGSILKILFSFLVGTNLKVFLGSSLLSASCIFLYWYNYLDKSIKQKNTLSYFSKMSSFKFIVNYANYIVLVLVLVCFFYLSLSERDVFFISIVAVLELYFIGIYFKLIKPILPLVFFFPIFSLIYANTTTAALDFNGEFEVITIALMVFFYKVNRFFEKNPKKQLIVMVTIILISFMVLAWVGIKKTKNTYMWWIGPTHSMKKARFEPSYSQLQGLRVDKVTKQVLEKTHSFVSKNSIANNDVYFFNLPVFYILENKLPPFRVVSHWFDVVTTNQIKKEYFSLKENAPQNVVAFYPEKAAFLGHAKMKNQVNPFYQDRILTHFENKLIYKFKGCQNYSMREMEYGEKEYLIELMGSIGDLDYKVNVFNKNNDAHILLTSSYVLKNSIILNEKKPVVEISLSLNNNQRILKGFEMDIIKFTNNIGRIKSEGFQSVCFFKKI